jgi:hypothetical protein
MFPQPWPPVAGSTSWHRPPGLLVIDIKWDSLPPLDATIVTQANNYVARSTDSGFNHAVMSANLIAGVTYEIRVNSYYGAQSFTLTAAFTPR